MYVYSQGQVLIVTERVCYNNHTKFQPLVNNMLWETEFSIFSPYKCIGTLTGPCRKKVKCQARVII